MTDKPQTAMIIEGLIFQLSRSVRGADDEGTSEITSAVSYLGFDTLDEDVREEVLQLAKHWGWNDGEEFFSSLKKMEAV